MEEMYKLLLKISEDKLPSFIITFNGKILPVHKEYLPELINEYIEYYKNNPANKEYLIDPNEIIKKLKIELPKLKTKINPLLYLLGAMKYIIVDKETVIIPLEYTKESIKILNLLINNHYLNKSYFHFKICFDYNKYEYIIDNPIRTRFNSTDLNMIFQSKARSVAYDLLQNELHDCNFRYIDDCSIKEDYK